MLCEACLTNDNYRFAYGCTGPCDNIPMGELVEAVDLARQRASRKQAERKVAE